MVFKPKTPEDPMMRRIMTSLAGVSHPTEPEPMDTDESLAEPTTKMGVTATKKRPREASGEEPASKKRRCLESSEKKPATKKPATKKRPRESSEEKPATKKRRS